MAEAPIPYARARHLELWIELSAVVLVFILPALFTSYADTHFWIAPGRHYTFFYDSLSRTVHDVGYSAVVLVIIWRSKEPLARFGLTRFRFGPDVLGGAGLAAFLWGLNWFVFWSARLMLGRENYYEYFRHLPFSTVERASGPWEYLLLAVTCVVSGFTQELIMRGYLIARLEELLNSTTIALFVSTVAFACYHGYQGNGGVLRAATHGLVLGITFCLFRRLGPLTLAHGVWNFLAGINLW